MKNEEILEEIDKIAEIAIRLDHRISRPVRTWKASRIIENRREGLLYDKLDDFNRVFYERLLEKVVERKERLLFRQRWKKPAKVAEEVKK